jgi:hypothetical protein
VALAVAGGAGIALYLLGWAISVEPEAAGVGVAPREPGGRRGLAFGLIVLGALLLLRSLGLWLGDAVGWPLVLTAFGTAVLWARSDPSDRARWNRAGAALATNPVDTLVGGRAALARTIVGALLVAAGVATFLATRYTLVAVGRALLAMAVAAAGLGLILGPWMYRLARQLAEERRERGRELRAVLRRLERVERVRRQEMLGDRAVLAHVDGGVDLALRVRLDRDGDAVRTARVDEVLQREDPFVDEAARRIGEDDAREIRLLQPQLRRARRLGEEVGDEPVARDDRPGRVDAGVAEALGPGGRVGLGVERPRPGGGVHPDGAGDVPAVVLVLAAHVEHAGRVRPLRQLGRLGEQFGPGVGVRGGQQRQGEQAQGGRHGEPPWGCGTVGNDQ